MAKKRNQVGGTIDVYLELDVARYSDTFKVVKAIEKLGGSVLHAFPPAVIVASVDSGLENALKKIPGVKMVSTETVAGSSTKKSLAAENSQVIYARNAWNDHNSVSRRLTSMDSGDLGKNWNTTGKLPPHPPAKIAAFLKAQEAKLAPPASKDVAGSPVLSIPVLVGRIAVGVVFVDSTVAAYKITDAEKGKVVNEITEGLNMLSAFEPRAGIGWYYDFKRPKISLTAANFPAAGSNGWEDTWRNAALGAMGYAASINGMNQYIADIKARNSAQHAYAIFVTKHPVTWFAYEWGNHVVMDFGVDGWGIDNFSRVVAHETGHVFGCPDEYGSCTTATLSGRYQIPNGNCQANPASIDCLMKGNSPTVCDFTRGHLGWNELAVRSKGSTTLKGTWTFDFDSGVQGPASGADIWWEQVNTTVRFLVPKSGAMLFNLGVRNFDAVSFQTLQGLSYTSLSINGTVGSANRLTAGTVIAIRTNSGRFAKMLVKTYGYNLLIDWVTYN